MAIDLLPFLQAVKQIEVPPSYTYEAGVGRYRNTKTGYFVARKVIERLLNDTEAATGQTLRALATALAQHRLPAKAWHLAMQQQLGRLHLQGAALGAGGFAALTPAALRRIEDALQADSERLFAFGEAIDAGAISEKQIINRIHMYIGNARLQYYHALPPPKTKAGHVVIERRVLRAGDNCDWCVYLAGLGWQPYGTLPLPGQAGADWIDGQCLTNCRCHIERKSVARRVADKLIRPLTAEFEPEAGHRHIIKGGPGSGHYNHQGIPEHQGGSLPGGGPKAAPKGKPKFAGSTTKFKAPKTDATPVDDAINRGDWDGDPLIRLTAGEWDREEYPDEPLDWLNVQRENNKDSIADRLSNGTSLSYDEANDFLGQWAETSNDHDLRSLRIQEAAAAEFGVPLTDWQKECLAVSNEQRANRLTDFFNTLDDERWDGEEAVSGLRRKLADYATWSTPFELEGLRALENDLRAGADDVVDSDDLWSRLETINDEGGAKVSEALRFTYAETQKALAEAGIKEVHLYRGVRQPNADFADHDEGETFKAETNALSSWSFALDPADSFMRGEDDEYMTGMVVDAVVPAARIFSTAATGPGCLTEWEMVVIGGKADPARVKRILRIGYVKAGAIIKGGPGSGHYNHAGIPEHQGGSLPSKGPKKTKLPALRQMGAWDEDDGPPTATEEEVLTLLAGGDDWSDNEEPDAESGLAAFETPFERDEDLKTAVVKALVDEIGVTKDMANVFIQDWSITSNDTNVSSLTHQRLAAEVFGTELTAWQKESLAEADALRRGIIDAYVAEQFEGDKPVLTKVALRKLDLALNENANDMHDPFYPFEAGILKAMVKEARTKSERVSRDEFMALVGTVEARSEALTRQAIQSVYGRTQAALAEAGIESLTLFRGAQVQDQQIGETGSVLRATTNALSSWTASEYTADQAFAYQTPEDYSDMKWTGVVFGARVPAARVYSLPTTGMGNLNEWEAIVIGSTEPEPMTIKTTYKERRQTMKGAGRVVKGGEGSGHFGHAGIPGHQGGSLPSTGGAYNPTMPSWAVFETPKAKKPKTPKAKKRDAFRVPTGNDLPVDEALIDHDYSGHPLLAATIGGGKIEVFEDTIDWEESQSEKRKEAVVAELSEGLGITYDEANEFIAQWAATSNDHDLRSLAIQEIAAEEFGVPLTPWQREKYDEIKALRTKKLDEVMDGITDDDLFFNAFDASEAVFDALRLDEDYSYPFEVLALSDLRDEIDHEEITIYNKAELREQLDAIEIASRDKVRQALRFTYNETQKFLADNGIKEVHLFRGALMPEAAGVAEGGTFDVATNPLSSWSFAQSIARGFMYGANGPDAADGAALVVDAIVPASRIYSTAVTGPGCLIEWEMIVLGSERDTVRAAKVSRVKKSTKAAGRIIKGGEGSGHFDHDGIPEHQGGSLPTYGRKKPAKPPKAPKALTGKGPKKAKGKIASLLDQLTAPQGHPPTPTPAPAITKPKAKPKAKPLVAAMTPPKAKPKAKPTVSDLVGNTTKPAKGAKLAPFGVTPDRTTPVDDVLDNHDYGQHPLTKMTMGEWDSENYDDPFEWMEKRMIEAKRTNALTLSKITGIGAEEANAFSAQWAATSNDSDLRSTTMQAQAAEEFGLALTDWQRQNLADTEARRQQALGGYFRKWGRGDTDFDAGIAVTNLRGALINQPELAYPFEQEALGKLYNEIMDNGAGIGNGDDLIDRLGEIVDEGKAKVRKAMRFTYNNTQALLRANGIKEVHLYRGALIPKADAQPMAKDKTHQVASNALSSWSFSAGTAENFMGGLSNTIGDDVPTMFDAVVPASRIFSTAVTGPGCMVEWEMIVMGSGNDTVRVYDIDKTHARKKATKSTITKGGPGSGFFGHVGRPGKRGGSVRRTGPAPEKKVGAAKPKVLVSKGPKQAKGKLASLIDQMTGAKPTPPTITKPKAAPKAAKPAPKEHPLIAEMTPAQAAPDTGTGFKVSTEQGSPFDLAIRNDAYTKDRMLKFMTGNPKKSHLSGWDLVEHQAEVTVEANAVEMAETLGIEYEDADALIGQWTISSNDHSLTSLGMQSLAAEEFGAPLSGWQTRRIAEVTVDRQRALDDVRRAIPEPDEWDGKAATETLYRALVTNRGITQPLEVEGTRRLLAEVRAGNTTIANEADLWQRFDAIGQAGLENTRKALRLTYNRTQAKLKAAGIKEVRLFRGAKMPPAGLAPEGGTMRNAHNTLSSWSASFDVADSFTFQSANIKGSGVVFDAVVPASRIYSTAATGIGTMTEWEVVVLGGADDPVRVYRRDDKD